MSLLRARSKTQEDSPSDIEGFLMKRGNLHKTWRVRWFVLRSGKVWYRKPEARSGWQGSIQLAPGWQVEISPWTMFGKKNVFFLSGPHSRSRQYVLAADSVDIRDRWVSEFSRVLNAMNGLSTARNSTRLRLNFSEGGKVGEEGSSPSSSAQDRGEGGGEGVSPCPVDAIAGLYRCHIAKGEGNTPSPRKMVIVTKCSPTLLRWTNLGGESWSLQLSAQSSTSLAVGDDYNATRASVSSSDHDQDASSPQQYFTVVWGEDKKKVVRILGPDWDVFERCGSVEEGLSEFAKEGVSVAQEPLRSSLAT